VISTGLGIFRGENENDWRPSPAPEAAAPARAIVSNRVSGAFYLAGWTGLYRSHDGGVTWSSITDTFPQEAVTAFLTLPGKPESLYAIVQGQFWASVDGGRSWAKRGYGSSPVNANAVAEDIRQPGRLWAAAADRLFRSDDGGANWRRVGRPLPEPNTTVHGIAASDEAIVLTTDRGLYRSVDGAVSWTPIIDNLPAHLEAGPLVRDPIDPDTLYAGFSLIPYRELWRGAADRESALARVSLTSLAGSVVLLILMALGALAALRWLGRFYPRSTPSTQTARRDGIGRKTLS
jgi:hypothetical protein